MQDYGVGVALGEEIGVTEGFADTVVPATSGAERFRGPIATTLPVAGRYKMAVLFF